MPSYIPSPDVNINNPQAVAYDQTAQALKAQYLPLLVNNNDAGEIVVDKINAAIQNFWLAGAESTAQALVVEASAAAMAIGAGPAAEFWAGSIQRVIDALNPPPPAPAQQAIVSADILVQIGEKQVLLAQKQAECSQLGEEIQALTAQLGEAMPPVGG